MNVLKARGEHVFRRRSSAVWLLVAVALFASGGASCPQFLREYPSTQARLLPENAALADVIAMVNNNTARIQTLYTSDAKISAPLTPPLRATLALERPRKFRLLGDTSLSGAEVDLGSNDELFWFWVRRNPTPGVFYCQHEQFATSAARQIAPIEPEWLVEALGVTGFDLNAEHYGPIPVGDGRLRIESPRQTSVGRVTKVTVVDEYKGYVVEQHLYDASGKLLASVLASEHQRDIASGAVLPRHIHLEAPQANFTLDLDLGNLQVNQVFASSAGLWSLPQYAGHQPVDLANLGASGYALPSAGR
jgi:hypothetical protein